MKTYKQRTITNLIIGCLFLSGCATAQKTITFNAKDGLKVTADLYEVKEDAPYIVLSHLSEHSRGEYKNTAVKLNALGFNCLAVDTRTGNEALGVINETAKEAKKQGLPTDFLSSEQDVLAAIDYADSLANHKGIILFGSSFSASLALKIGVSNPKVKAIVAFSPGEHFGDKLTLRKEIENFNKPFFVTSSKKEAPDVATLISNIKSKTKEQFIPKRHGAHGSIALWDYTSNNEEYWLALTDFLKSINNSPKENKNANTMKLNAGIITNKLKETKEFYTQKLGFGVTFENEFYLLMHTPNQEAQISFLEPEHPTQKPIFQKPFQGEGVYLTIEVDDVDELYESLKKKSVKIEIALRDEPWGDRHFAVVDPNGIGIDFVRYTDPNED